MGLDCELFPLDFENNIDDIEQLILSILEIFPGFNLLINSASVYDQAPILKTDKKLLDKQFNVNFKAPFLLSKFFATYTRSGNIINILDNKISFNQYQYASYLLSKKALTELTLMSSIEFAPKIRVNGIAPGVILPAETRTSDYIDWRISKIPLKMKGELSNIMQALDYIINNSFVTGQILTIDGGESCTNIGFNAGTFTGGYTDE